MYKADAGSGIGRFVHYALREVLVQKKFQEFSNAAGQLPIRQTRDAIDDFFQHDDSIV